MSYEDATFAAQMIAMAIFGAVMIAVLIYALRPANKKRFEKAARLALETDETCGTETRDGR